MAGNVRPATIGDAIYLAPRLRQADKDECIAAIGKTPAEILPGSIRLSTVAYTMISPHGDRIGLFGVTPMPGFPDTGAIWMVATPDLVKHTIPFLRQCRGWIDKLHAHYPFLINLVDARNTVHIRWIEWCGFTLLMKRPYGPQGLPFIEFAKVKA